jgi:hypothetical protein
MLIQRGRFSLESGWADYAPGMFCRSDGSQSRQMDVGLPALASGPTVLASLSEFELKWTRRSRKDRFSQDLRSTPLKSCFNQL